MPFDVHSFFQHFTQHMAAASTQEPQWELVQGNKLWKEFFFRSARKELRFITIYDPFLVVKTYGLERTDTLLQIISSSLKSVSYKGILVTKEKEQLGFHPLSPEGESIMNTLQPLSAYFYLTTKGLELQFPYNKEHVIIQFKESFSNISLKVEGEPQFDFEHKQQVEEFVRRYTEKIEPLQAASDRFLAAFRHYDPASFATTKEHYFVFEQKETLRLHYSLKQAEKPYEASLSFQESTETFSQADELITDCVSKVDAYLRKKRLKALLENRINNVYFQLCTRFFEYEDSFDDYYYGPEPLTSVKQYLRDHAADYQLKPVSLKEKEELKHLFFSRFSEEEAGNKPEFIRNSPFHVSIYGAFSFGRYLFISGNEEFKSDTPALYVLRKSELKKAVPDGLLISQL